MSIETHTHTEREREISQTLTANNTCPSPSAAGIFSGKITPDTATPGSRWDPSVRQLSPTFKLSRVS
jgi:hypothetical protein